MEPFQCLNVLFLAAMLSPIFVSSHSENSLVLLVSFDGFRWDYLDMVKRAQKDTPTFDRLRREGVVATKGIKNAFITKTFPNHYTIATGMYEVNHGVVSTTFYDPDRKVVYDAHNETHRFDAYYWNNGTEPGDVWRGEPIWITNQKGTTPVLAKRSGTMMWPGGDVQIHGQYPSRYKTYNHDTSAKTKIDQIVNWFTDGFSPINLGLLYFDEPDTTGHSVGPDSPEMIDLIVSLDDVLKTLMERLEEHKLLDHINLIVTSDHGMARTDHVIYLEDYVDSSLYFKVAGSAFAHIWPHEGRKTEVFQKLNEVPHLQTYLKKDIPEQYHYTFNKRVPPILILAEEGYNICQTKDACGNQCNHGYDNKLPDMHPFFMARGPAFRQHYAFTEMFDNVDIYPLLCHILEVKPAQHDGSLDNVRHLLAAEHEAEVGGEEGFFTTTMVTFLLVMVMAALFSGVWCVAACRTSRIHTRRLRIPVAIPLNGNHFHHDEGETHLLASEEEELP